MPSIFLILIVLVVCSSSTFADDLYSPWYRYTEDTAYATWSFSEAQEGWWLPDPGAYPHPEAAYIFTYLPEWFPELDGREGILSAAGAGDTFLLPNWDPWDPFPAMDMYVQVVCHESGMVDGIFQTWVPSWFEITHEIELEEGWWYRRFHVWIRESPAHGEHRFILGGDAGVVIDQIVVDYMPEPTTLSLLALGGLAVVWRRR